MPAPPSLCSNLNSFCGDFLHAKWGETGWKFMRSRVNAVSGNDFGMSGDTKTKSRKRKRNDQVERFNESHLALQRAMEKDYRTGKQARRSEESERASAQRAEEKDANAARLAALLDAARR